MNMISELKKKLRELIETGFKKCQNDDGGIPPFPGTVLDSGLISTAEFLHSTLEYKECQIEKTYMDYYGKAFSGIIKENIKEGLEFLLRNQLDNGGFPPLADIYWIRKDFTESTATAILALSKGLENLDTLVENENKPDWEKRIKNSLEKAYERLLNTRMEDKGECYWNTGENPTFGEKRIFSTIMAGKALNEYLNLVKHKNIEDKFDWEDVFTTQNKVSRLLLNLIRERGVLSHDIKDTNKAQDIVKTLDDYSGPVILPKEDKHFTPIYGYHKFAINGKIFREDYINFSNMALAVSFLYETQKIDSKRFFVADVSESCWPIEKILEEHILDEEYSFEKIDIDEINLEGLKNESLPSHYGFEHPQKLSVMLMEKTIIKRLFDDGDYEEYCENLLSYLKDKNYCYLLRGHSVPSTLATAYAIRGLGEFIKQSDKVNELFPQD